MEYAEQLRNSRTHTPVIRYTAQFGGLMGFLAGVSHLRYYRRVGPDERVDLVSRLERRLGSAAKFDVEASVAGERVLRGQITVGGITGDTPTS